ncbi:MAG: coniferyl-aldehyde dehydrogenase [Gammaproteobacteria bacterium]
MCDRQIECVSGNPYPILEQRLDWLNSLEKMLIAWRDDFAASLNSDFGAHSKVVTDLYETGAILGRSRYFRRQLPEWITAKPVSVHPKVHGSSRAETRVVPKGVVGNISPWNFPVECALVMAVDMLSAGNRVILKSARQAPATAQAVSEAIAEFFDEDVFASVTGGSELTQAFPHKPWDHLTYTGSPEVGKIILRAAAENLTPVTLELGGKNPTVFAEDAIEDSLIRRFLEARILKGGQVCTSPDYVLVPRKQRDEWLQRAQRLWSEMYPTYVGHQDATGVINQSHYDRVMGYIKEAQDEGVEVVSLNGDEPDAQKRQIPMYVVVEPNAELACMREEIFGPVTALLCYDDIDEAISRINSGPSPLACYLATHNSDVAERFILQVRSGGVAINDFGTQAGHPGIPFGGFGQSGMGCHSGYEGFLNYSHTKGVFHGAEDSAVVKSMRMPYGESAEQLVKAIFG